jgi:hypothetical protein
MKRGEAVGAHDPHESRLGKKGLQCCKRVGRHAAGDGLLEGGDAKAGMAGNATGDLKTV